MRTTSNQIAGLAQKGCDSAVPVSEQPSALLFASEVTAVYHMADVPLRDGAQLAVVLDNPSDAQLGRGALSLPERMDIALKVVSMHPATVYTRLRQLAASTATMQQCTALVSSHLLAP